MPDLYVVYLGGSLREGRVGEDHETVVVVADNTKDARTKAKAKWGGDSNAHVDHVLRINAVDGYRVDLIHHGGADYLYHNPEYVPAGTDEPVVATGG